MPRYIITLTNDEIQELKAIIQKGGKGYRIKHAQILLKLDQKPETRHGHMTASKMRMEPPVPPLQVLRNGLSWEGWRQPLGGRYKKPPSQGDGRCGGPDMCHSLFGTAGRSLTLDYAGNRG